MLAIIIGLSIGFGLPIQTSINSRLRKSVGSPFVASMTSFTVGTIFLAIITLFSIHTLFFKWSIVTSQPWWLWLGGLLGVVYLTGNILLFPKLGSVQTVIMPVLGQIIAGLVIDNFGLFYSPISHLTGIRLAGALLVLCGVIITVAGKGWIDARHNKIDKQTENDNKQYGLWLWRIAGIVTGVLSAMQTAINGHLGTVLHSSVHAAFVSFLVGTVCLIIIVAIMRLPLKIDKTNSTSNPWWMWMGGIIGALFVLGNVVMVPLVGTGLAVVIVLVGLMIGSLLIDQFGWLESPRNPIAVIQIIGILIMIIGVGFIRIF